MFSGLNMPLMMNDIADIETPLMNVWHSLYMDAGDYNAAEKAELVLDRVGGEAGKVIDDLIRQYGYDAVEHLVARTLFGEQ
jgi:hypothetical protein